MNPALHWTDPTAWLDTLSQPQSLWSLLAFVAVLGLSWLLVGVWRRRTGPDQLAVLLGRQGVDGVLFPALLLGGVYASSVVLRATQQDPPLVLLHVLLPACVSLALIRLGVKVLQVALGQSPWVRAMERTLSWLAWGAVVLWVTGILPLILKELDEIHWKVGGSLLSVRTLIEGALTAGAVLILTLWMSSALETRLLRSATGSDLSLRKVVSNAVRALLMFVGLLLALSSVGIDLTALSVLGGALGVGLGFGLQKLAANYVSGFVVLAERSLRIGDTVRVDNFEGRVTDIKARFTVIRAPSGRESIVPNEMLITQRVENLSLADSRVSLTTVLLLEHGAPIEETISVLSRACRAPSRVLSDPAPAVMLSAITPQGLEWSVVFWVNDPENGLLNVRSQVNQALLSALREAGIALAQSAD